MTTQLTIGTQTYALECTLDAFRSIPSALGGFTGTYAKLASADPDTCVFIIAAAIGKARDFEAQNVIADVLFKAGLDKNLFDTLTKYVGLLQNGGKTKSPGTGDASGE